MYKTRLKSGDYLDYAVEYYRQNLKTFLGMTLFFHIPVTFLIFFLLDIGNFVDNMTYMMLTEDFEMGLIKIMLLYLGIILYSFYNATILHAVSLGTIKHTYEKLVNGVDYTAKQSISYGFKRLLWYILYLFIVSFVTGFIYNIVSFVVALTFLSSFMDFGVIKVIIGAQVALALIVAVVYFMIRLYFIPHAISIERIDCFKALSLSWNMTKGRVKKVFWPICFGVIFCAALPFVIRSLNNFLIFNDPLVNRILAALIMSISSVLHPILYIHTTQLYIYLKHETGMIEFMNKLGDLVAGESDRITFGKDREVAG